MWLTFFSCWKTPNNQIGIGNQIGKTIQKSVKYFTAGELIKRPTFTWLCIKSLILSMTASVWLCSSSLHRIRLTMAALFSQGFNLNSILVLKKTFILKKKMTLVSIPLLSNIDALPMSAIRFISVISTKQFTLLYF